MSDQNHSPLTTTTERMREMPKEQQDALYGQEQKRQQENPPIPLWVKTVIGVWVLMFISPAFAAFVG